MANKKINQLVSKTAILSTDIFGIGDATTGQLFKKTIAELQAAIGGAVISVNGLVGTVVLDTDDIQELATPTNKYFTDARARGAISLTVTGNSGASTYSSGTGVLNVPTYTLAGLGGITATFLSGTSGISYNSTTGVISYSGTVYTDASIRALFSAGTGISYNSSTGAISYSGTVYTDSSVRALISMTTTGTSGASTYNNTTGVINVPNYTLAGLGGISLTSLSGGTGITYNNTTGAISYSGTVYTDASVRALFSGSGSVSYNSSTGVISSSITQYTDALARASVSLTTTGTSGASTYNSTTGVLNIPQYASAFSGTTNYVSKFTSSTAIGNSQIFDNGTNVGIGTASPITKFHIAGTNVVQYIESTTTTNYAELQILNTTNYFQVGIEGVTPNTRMGGTIAYNAYLGTYNNYGMTFHTNNLNRLTITSAGYVGISTSSPTGLLQLNGSIANSGDSATFTIKQSGTSYNNGIYIERSGERNGYFMYIGGGADALTFRRNYFGTQSDVMSLTRDGDIFLLGTINSRGSTDNVTVQNYYRDGTYEFGVQKVAGRGTDLFFTGDSNFNIVKRSTYGSTGGTIYFRVASSGNTLLGTETDNGERLYVSGAIRATGTITANSDISLKKNLLKIENALEKVEQINGYTYEFKADDSKRHAGVIAQEIQTVLPEIVNKGNDGILGVEYGNISALLIEAIKEQQTQINELKALLNK